MKTETYTKGIVFESDTYYLGDQSEYHFYLDEATYCTDRDYVCASTAAGDSILVAFVLRNLKNVTLDFGGARLVLHGRIAPFVFDHCENVTLKNCSIDYDRPFYTQADILEADTEHLRLRIADGFPYRVEGNYLVAVSETWENYMNHKDLLLQPYERETLAPAPVECILALIGEEIFDYPNPPLPIRHLYAEEDGDTVILHGEFPGSYKAGHIIAITHEPRDKNSILVVSCKDVLVENVRIICGASMGFVSLYTENITLRGFNMYTDELSRGVVANNADAIHCYNCSGTFIIEDCILESMLDDTINIHGNYTTVKQVKGNEIIALLSCHGLKMLRLYSPGDQINIYRGHTQELLDTFTVLEVSDDGKKEITLKLDKPVVGINEGDLIENYSAMPEITMRRCRTGKLRGGMRLQSRRKTLIEDCCLNTVSEALHLTGDSTYWFESGPVNDLTVRNCRFAAAQSQRISIVPQVEFTPDAPYYHNNITICDNIFESPFVLYGHHADNLVIKNNKYEPAEGSQTDESGLYVRIKDCGNCDITEAEVRE